MVADERGRQLLVFGGRKENGRRASDLHLLSLDSWTWFAPKLDSEVAPPPREQCAAACADGKLLLFGGRTNGARLNDLWLFDTATWRWEQLPVHGTAPSPRQGAAACLERGTLWLVGGASNFVLSDAFCYSLEHQVGGSLLDAWARQGSCGSGCASGCLGAAWPPAGVAGAERGQQRWQASGAGRRACHRPRRRGGPAPVWRPRRHGHAARLPAALEAAGRQVGRGGAGCLLACRFLGHAQATHALLSPALQV